MKRVQLLINGQVTGVGFRFNLVKIAQDLGIRGWCKNNSTTQVEVIAEGEESALKNFITWCQQGPQGAQVSGVTSNWQEATGEFEGFTAKLG